MPTLNKNKVIAAIVAQIETTIKVLTAAIGDSHTAATHEETQAKSKYDTFALESSYLANGQTRRLSELDEALTYFKSIQPASPSPTTTLNTLVKISKDDKTVLYIFLASVGGGIRVEVDNQTVAVVTPDSPLGEALLGAKEGDMFEIKIKGQDTQYEVLGYY